LISAGFKHIDAVSFVSPNAVPQMADSEEVLKQLDPPDDVEIIGIVVNEKGAQRAIETQAVHTLGFPYSISETFCARIRINRPKTHSKNWKRFRTRPTPPRWTLWSISQWRSAIRMAICGILEEVIEAISLMEVDNLRMISLADTVGMATPEQVSEL
jgi:hydroxymethylglutaryl-CoA lyase